LGRGGVELTFYGGVGEIGGNAVLLRDHGFDVSLMLDFGISYSRWSQYFNFPFSMPKNIEDLIRCCVLPDVKGLYAGDEEESSLDACLISHAHADHYRYVSVLKEGTRVFMPECGHGIIRAIEEVRPRTRFDEAIIRREYGGELDIEDFRTGGRIRVGGVEVEPVHVDHSIPGAYAFLVHTSAGLVVYSGDFRGHGARNSLTEDLVEEIQGCGEDVEALLCEGTNAVGGTPMTEGDVRVQTSKIVEAADGLVLIDSSHADLDRTRTIAQVAQDSERSLVLSPKIANILHTLVSDPKLKDTCQPILENSSVFFGSRKRWEAKRRTKLETKILDALGDAEIFSEEIQKAPSKYVLATNLYGFEDIKDLKPPPGSVYILSSSEPFNEEREYDFERLIRWLDIYGIPQVQIHASGHATPMYIREVVKRIRPRRLFPIHTEHPEMMGVYLRDACREVHTPQRGSSFRFG